MSTIRRNDKVADIIGIPGNTVKTRMFYTRKHLSELLRGADLIEPDHRDDALLCALPRCSGGQSKTL